MAKIIEKKKSPGWKDRHIEVKRYKNNTKRTWMHLVIGENRITNEKVLRLLKPFNYFSIPDKETYKKIVKLLTTGGNEINWLNDDDIKEIEGLDSKISLKVKEIVEKKKTGQILTKNDIEILKSIKEIGLDNNIIVGLLKSIKIKGASDVDITKTTEILREISLHDVNNFSETIKNRLEKINFFKKISISNKTYEIRGAESIHRFLENNMWIIDERYWLMHSNETLRTIIGEKVEKDPAKRPDFVCGTVNNKLIIIELKRPAHKLQVEDLNQLENYLSIIESHTGEERSDYECYLVGKEIADDLRKKIKHRSTKFKIRTFNDLIEDVEKRYSDFKK